MTFLLYLSLMDCNFAISLNLDTTLREMDVGEMRMATFGLRDGWMMVRLSRVIFLILF
jgi:hypothetical protein